MDVKCWLMAAGATIVGPVPGVGQALALVDEASLDAAVLDVNLGLGDTPYPVAVAWAALQEPYIFATGDMRLSDANGAQDCPRLTALLGVEFVQAVMRLITGPKLQA